MPADSGSSLMSTFFMIALMVAAFYFLIIRPTKRRTDQQKQMVKSLTPGARIMTTSGVFGTIRHLGDSQAVIEIAPEVEMTITKTAILREVTSSEEEFEYDDEDSSATGDPEETTHGVQEGSVEGSSQE